MADWHIVTSSSPRLLKDSRWPIAGPVASGMGIGRAMAPGGREHFIPGRFSGRTGSMRGEEWPPQKPEPPDRSLFPPDQSLCRQRSFLAC